MYRMNRMLKRDDAKVHWKKLEPLVTQGVCPECGGARLNPKIFVLQNCREKHCFQVSAMPLGDLLQWLEQIREPVALDIKDSLRSRIRALIEIGLDYLTLDRSMGTLSGGEAQRCKIAKI